MNPRPAIDELIYRSCMLLDEKDFAGYLELCDPAFRYVITAYSPEIKKEMTWLEHDKEGMKMLFANLPKHNSDHSPLTRHATVYTVAVDEAQAGQAEAVSALQVFRTTLDGGATEFFAVGRLHDTIRLGPGGPKLMARRVQLQTRMFGIGYHIPF